PAVPADAKQDVYLLLREEIYHEIRGLFTSTPPPLPRMGRPKRSLANLYLILGVLSRGHLAPN
ncbi:MAG TPA: hypothetical protein VE860_01370, partial [Chthoniobacterales bacterium]|nr:hypothetical protein [Chthoniobacterales bacterium]